MQEGESSLAKRQNAIIKTSAVGITTNVLLVAFKALMGFLSGSVALVIDAVNNLTDALSSLVALIGAKLAKKAPDKKHPYGHGRIEYIAEMIVAAVIIAAGILAIAESIKTIFEPSDPDYTFWAYIVMGVSIVLKIALGIFARRMGKKIGSGVLIGIGADALLDALLTFSVLVSALIFFAFGVSIESYVGVLIGLFIIRSGILIVLDASNRLIGLRSDAALTSAIKKTILAIPGVIGAYDLMVTDFGPERIYAQVHIEVDGSLSAMDIDRLSREAQERVYQENHVFLTSVGIYAHDDHDQKALSMEETCHQKAMSHPEVLETHGFRVDEEAKTITFDAVVSFDVTDRDFFQGELTREIRAIYPTYNVFITLDGDMSD